MAGDHKCTVCHATFTRPQHVARHMRSHTGDRPYKCQHCGDQFARSDLLARHINKCHANEKQALALNGNRRKGSASASRATTSKQACDQCVLSSLPCDGSNPCSKCVQRKSRCTFVKFHRQTAPTGPGHDLRPPTTQPRLTSQPHADDFIIGSPPVNMAPSPDTYAFNFSHVYPSSDHHHHQHQLSTLPDAPDFSAKYRAQAEFLRREGGGGGGGASTVAHPNDQVPLGIVPGLYTDPQATTTWFGWGGQDGAQDQDLSAGQNDLNMHDPTLSNRYFIGESEQSQLSEMLGGDDGLNASDTHTTNGIIHANTYNGGSGRHRRESIDFGSSDSGSTSHSVPSSASSSNIHLPLDASSRQQQQMAYHDLSHHRSRNNSVQTNQVQYPMHHDIRHSTSHPNLQTTHEGGFSSAFGLMSIDDPNMIAAGLATDGAPFFSSAAMNMTPADPNITPMPNKQQRERDVVSASLPTPGLSREAELREFWKEYMQSPPTGPAHDSAGQSGGAFTDQRPPSSPNGSRRVRVASLPSTQTPLSNASKYINANHCNVNGTNGTSSIRTTLHGSDDLRSYEAAVLARKTPTLNLVPRRGRGSMSVSSTSPSNPPFKDIASSSSLNKNNYSVSRPSSSASTSSSSLAHALDRPSLPRLRVGIPSEPGTSFTSPPSRESSVSEEALSDRPSFKRLPSQTLGPINAKRAQLSNELDVVSAHSIPDGVNISRSLTGFTNHSGIPNHRPMNNGHHPTLHVPSIAAYAAGGGGGGTTREVKPVI